MGASKAILQNFGGQVPRTMEEMLTLPGAARKTANVVLGTAFGIASGVVVDTHVIRISNRLDLTRNEDPKKIEQDLMQVIPKEKWIRFFTSDYLARPASLRCTQTEMRGVQSREDLLFQRQNDLGESTSGIGICPRNAPFLKICKRFQRAGNLECAPCRSFTYHAAMRILLVEDDLGVRRFVVKGLREQAYAVDAAATGDDALYQADINEYDLIILDVMIPGTDGFEVCRKLRKAGRRMPILMLTARDAVEDRVSGLDSGADDYLTNHLSFANCLPVFAHSCWRSAELHPPRLSVGDLVLDTAAQNATLGGHPISLTHKEYALLEYLVRNAGRVVSRADIAEHVWDETFDPFSNLIEVYINRLRRKIDPDGNAGLLQTRRGAGYILKSGEDADGIGRGPSQASPASRARRIARNMLDSVRVRLTVWYSAVLAVVLILVCVTTYLIVQKNVDAKNRRRPGGVGGLVPVPFRRSCRTLSARRTLQFSWRLISR